jgi:hypothetical protein
VIQSRCADIDPGFFFISGQTVKLLRSVLSGAPLI